MFPLYTVASYDTDKNAYSYKLNSAWNGFPAYSTTIDGNLVSASTFFSVNSAGYIEWNDAKKDAGADFAKLAKAFVVEKNIAWDKTETATDAKVTFTDLTLGYYLVDTSLGSLCSLDTTAPSVTIKEKNSDAQTLDISGTGIMGYITIPKISVELPIYHGTDEGVLQVAAGHLEGSSLPVGGAGTHAVISAHRGLPSAKLFTNLDELEVGDRFTITVLNRVLTYEVDQISIVLPTEIDQLLPTEGMDYVTLMTCTPYGINTHRLLVRGKRVETTESQKHIRVAADAFRIEPIIVAPILAIPMLLAALVGVLVAPHLRKRSKRRRK